MMRVLNAAAFAAALIAASPALAGDLRRSVLVAGEASVEATPNFATVTLGVATAGKDAGQAMAANAKATAGVIEAVKAEGVAAANIQTSNVSVSPDYANPAQGSSAPPAIVGYSVSNMVTVTVKDLPRLGALIDRAMAAGANTVSGIAFGEDNVSALLDKARPLAVADARRKADIYAAAAGAKVGRLIELSDQVAAEPRPYARMYAASAAAPPPIEAGQDRLSISVSARFELVD